VNVTTTRIERMIPPETAIDAWLDDAARMAPSLIQDYCARHGLKELPRPTYVNGDMAIFYEEVNGKYVETIRNATPSGLVSALEKRLLLAPASVVEKEVETLTDPSERDASTEDDAGIRYEKCPTCKLEFKIDPAQPLSKGRFTAHKNRHGKLMHAK
jgi:hypothetical protein